MAGLTKEERIARNQALIDMGLAPKYRMKEVPTAEEIERAKQVVAEIEAKKVIERQKEAEALRAYNEKKKAENQARMIQKRIEREQKKAELKETRDRLKAEKKAAKQQKLEQLKQESKLRKERDVDIRKGTRSKISIDNVATQEYAQRRNRELETTKTNYNHPSILPSPKVQQCINKYKVIGNTKLEMMAAGRSNPDEFIEGGKWALNRIQRLINTARRMGQTDEETLDAVIVFINENKIPERDIHQVSL